MEEKYVGMYLQAIGHLLSRKFQHNEFMRYYHELTGTHGYVLGYIFRKLETGDCYQRDIEQKFEIRRSTATQMLKLMEKNGLIVRESVDFDGRLKRILVTDKSREIKKYLDKELRAAETEMTEGIDEEEMAALFATLDKIKNNLTSKQGVYGKDKEQK